MSLKAQTQATALAAARSRRQQLDMERDERDRRIEAAVAATMLAIAARDAQLCELDLLIGDVKGAFETLLAQNVSLERAANLLELTPLEVKRLMRQPKPEAQSTDARIAQASSSAEMSQRMRR